LPFYDNPAVLCDRKSHDKEDENVRINDLRKPCYVTQRVRVPPGQDWPSAGSESCVATRKGRDEA
jgi:hypothetical protein